ncbi:MAG: nickel pincer cofactor biosynthesis protein LarB [Tissierellia bacterium]|nr:nickel pincer cofactor biosynthesis protein LarB [Tissierellia bacterium]
MNVDELLAAVAAGKMDLNEAKTWLKKLPYEDIGVAKLDHHRSLRRGFGEVIFGQGKSVEDFERIFRAFHERGEAILSTRTSKEQYAAVAHLDGAIAYDSRSRILTLKGEAQKKPPVGAVAVLTGGTADLPVAEEAAQTAEFFGAKVQRFYDVGVAGLHRLLDQLEAIQEAKVIVAVAGMEGALPGVVAGLVSVPVLGVPTSVGYGANFGGLSALLTMLNSCSEGVSVVNIDNGFGAGYSAAQMNRLMASEE